MRFINETGWWTWNTNHSVHTTHWRTCHFNALLQYQPTYEHKYPGLCHAWESLFSSCFMHKQKPGKAQDKSHRLVKFCNMQVECFIRPSSYRRLGSLMCLLRYFIIPKVCILFLPIVSIENKRKYKRENCNRKRLLTRQQSSLLWLLLLLLLNIMF